MLEQFMKADSNGAWEISDFGVIPKIMAYRISAEEAEGNKYIISDQELRDSIMSFFGLNRGLERCAVQAVEHEINTNIFGYPVKCIIDRIDIGSPERLIDYKTGNRKSVTRAQLNFYGLCYTGSNYRPVDLQYQFLKTGESSTWTFGKAEAAAARAWMEASIQEIEGTTFFVKNTYLCNWCGVQQMCR
jgi:hypothetical protein